MRTVLIVMVFTVLCGLNAVCLAGAATPAFGAEIAISADKEADELSALANEARWLELLAAATDASHRNPDKVFPIICKLKSLRMLGDTDAGLAQADQALLRFPGDPYLLLERAWIQTFKAAWPKALADAQAASEGKPELSEALIVQGIAYREMRDWDHALAVFTRAAELRPQDPVPPLNRARAYVEKGLWDEAFAPANRAISLSPDAPEAYVLRARAFAGNGKLVEAARDLNHAIRLNPRMSAPYVERADVLARSSQWEAAAKDAYTAIVLGSRDQKAYLTACEASVALGDWNALSGYAEGGMLVAPDNVMFPHFAAKAYSERGELTKALAVYDQALQRAPRDANLLLERATTSVMLRRYPQAVDDCTAALALKPSASAYALRGFARFKTGNRDAAFEDCTNALTLEPKTATAMLVRATINLERGKAAEALAESAQALKLDPAQAWSYVTYGSALLASGRTDEALKVLDQAVALAPKDAQARLARGRCLAVLGRNAEARADIEKAASLDGDLRPDARAELEKMK